MEKLRRIPEELRALPTWACANADKVPVDPRPNGGAASSTDPSTWCTFDEAFLGVASGRFLYLGIMLNGTHTVIDQDNKPTSPATPDQLERHARIRQHFDTYTERSCSRTGFHSIVRGAFDGKGLHRDNVEVYCRARFMVCTGDIFMDLPIAERPELLALLVSEMRPEMSTRSADLVEVDETIEDLDLVEMAQHAVNGEKFDQLCNGLWESMHDGYGRRLYTSQSEADHALLAMLAFYSPSNAQVKRLFRMSRLGQREKAQRNDDYLDYSLEKIRAKEPPPVPASTVEALTQPPRPKAAKTAPTTFPPGLVGDIARFIAASAIRPAEEIGVAGAIGLMAGVAGRAFNISNTGLNHYIILVASTGTGKEAMQSGISKLIAAVRTRVPTITDMLGPSGFSSGQAILRVIGTRRHFVSMVGEFGLVLQQMCDPRAPGHLVMLRKVLLDLYQKSGKTDLLQATAYADTDKSIPPVCAPSVSILGDTTPTTFLEGITHQHVAEGLIPRFLVVQYDGGRPGRNKRPLVIPPPALVERFVALATAASAMALNDRVVDVEIEESAATLLDAFDNEADAAINSGTEVIRQLWTRAHLKALRLAGLLAVGVDHNAPKVTEEVAAWAIDYIRRDVSGMASRFENGEVGNGGDRAVSDTRRVLREYFQHAEVYVQKYKVRPDLVRQGIVTHDYLSKRLSGLAAFHDHRLGPAAAIDQALRTLIDNGELVAIPKNESSNKTYGTQAKVYKVTDGLSKSP